MSRKVVLYIANSLDGFIADKTGGVSWLCGEDINIESDYGYSEFIKNVDTVIMGMSTYSKITKELSPNDWPYIGMKTYVFTHQQKKNTDNIEFICDDDIEKFILDIKNQEGKDIWICGGANIINQLIRQDIIDKFYLSVIPVILGNGIRLFDKENPKTLLKLEETMQCNGVINLKYSRR